MVNIEIPAYFLLLFSIPVLLLGEWIVNKISFLGKLNIPVSVVGGLAVSTLITILNMSNLIHIHLLTKVYTRWWTWIVTPEVEWIRSPDKNIELPLLVAFFTTIGLNASWQLVKNNSTKVLIYTGLAGLLVVCQNLVGLALAYITHKDPLFGLMCGSISMSGGHGTALGFANTFEKAGLLNASTIGATAATLGLVGGALVGGPLGGFIIRKRNLKPDLSTDTQYIKHEEVSTHFLETLRDLFRCGKRLVLPILVTLFCIKAGSWLSYGLQSAGFTFPVYIGAMILGVIIRNLLEHLNLHILDSHTIGLLGTVLLCIFLSISMMKLNIAELHGAATIVICIVLFQVLLMLSFAYFLTFRYMGRNYDAAVMAGGHCGFGLGAVPAAMANIETLVETYGPSPAAFLIVPIVGVFLVDLLNAFTVTAFLNFIVH